MHIENSREAHALRYLSPSYEEEAEIGSGLPRDFPYERRKENTGLLRV